MGVRRKQWLQVTALASVTCVSLTMVISACSSDDAANPGGVPEAGADTGKTPTPTPDASEPDTYVPVKPDAALLPDGDCGDGDTNPYCDPKLTQEQRACPSIGQGEHKLDTADRTCNNCLRQNCCDTFAKCFGNGIAPDDGGIDYTACLEVSDCYYNCVGNEDAGGCKADCVANAPSEEAVKLADDVNACAKTCRQFPSWYNNGAELCEQFDPVE